MVGFQTSELNLPTLTIFHATCLENLLDRVKTSIQKAVRLSPQSDSATRHVQLVGDPWAQEPEINLPTLRHQAIIW
jgi:hypothetical protein